MNTFTILKNYFEDISDPRVLGRTQHKLIDILVMGVIAIMVHAETWVEMEEYCNSNIDWFKKFLDLNNGVPSHDTFCRVFSLIDPVELESAFMKWVEDSRNEVSNDVIAIDGKAVKGTKTRTSITGRSCLNIVSAWSTQSNLVLGQIKAASGGRSESTAAKSLIDQLNIKGMTIVGDAGVGTRSLLEKIIDKEANYIFPVKNNSRKKFTQIKKQFDGIADRGSRSKKVETCSVSEDGHGRKDFRSCTIIRKANLPPDFNLDDKNEEHYKKLNVIGRIVYRSEAPETRPLIQTGKGDGSSEYKAPESGMRIKEEVRYFVTSLNGSPRELLEKMRLQWSIESKLHWVLDVGFGEDANKTRNRVAAQNLCVARKIALNLARHEKTVKAGAKAKLKKAGWDSNYLEKLLFQDRLGT